jgi:hypothetical protein
MAAEHRTRITFAEQTMPLQFRRDHLDEMTQSGWQRRHQQDETVGAAAFEPFLYQVGSLRRCAVEAVAGLLLIVEADQLAHRMALPNEGDEIIEQGLCLAAALEGAG